MMLRFVLLACGSAGIAGLVAAAEVEEAAPLEQAHAHNDYLHERPLQDALSHGFCSVEADVFLVDGRLLVAHTRRELDDRRTLKRLYLDPLRKRVRTHGGRVWPDGPALTLLIDIKNRGADSWRVLNTTLAGYPELFACVKDGVFHDGPVHAVVSGDRAWDAIAAAPERFAGVDGRLSDLGSDRPVHLMPLISDNWRRHFRWRGIGPFSETERSRLQELVRTAHREKRRIRFWATPDTPAMWKELADAGVDLINTDDLDGLSTFLRARHPVPR